jgi:uncharacterized protein YfaS (alpha-2-macroglobulin family)
LVKKGEAPAMTEQPNRRVRRLRLALLAAIIVLTPVAIFLLIRALQPGAGEGQVIPVPDETAGITGGEPLQAGGGGTGFVIRLSEGQEQPEVTEPLVPGTGEPLSEVEIAPILARLPALEEEPDESQDFRLPEDPIPPPRPGETIEEAFPPPPLAGGPEIGQAGPLEVLRYAPEGEISIAPFVSVTFSQPMVPLATLEDLAEQEVPVEIEPDLPGTWRWLGTKTLTFQYDSELIDRLPKSTAYTVSIPAGIQSEIGGVLAESVQFTFQTPTPTMSNHYPYSDDPQPLDPLFFIAFDQRVDPEAVLATIRVTAGAQPVAVRLATAEEVQKHASVGTLAESAGASRWLAFKAKASLPPDTDVSVVIGPGTPSAEGPLLTQTAQSFGFHTYAPLRIEDYGCAWYTDDCPPLAPLFIEFNNPIDRDAYQESMLRIDPELPGASANVYGDTISIRGATRGQTTYRVIVDANIQDVFGQTLGKDTSLRFRIGSAEPLLIGPDEIFITLDPSSDEPALSLYAINHDRLDVRIYAVEAEDWPAFLKYLEAFNRTDTPPDPPGRLVRDETMRLDLPQDVLSEVDISLSEYLDGGFGQFIVIARPPRSIFEEDRYWETIHAWVQVTQIGLDAFVDHSEMVVWATALADGAPLGNVTIEAGPGRLSKLTAADGIVRFAIPAQGVSYLVARQGKDEALLPPSTYYWGDDSWHQNPPADELRWYVFDDRGMYRPGEEVHVKGWMRRIGGGQTGDVGLVGRQVSEVSYQIIGPQGNELGNGRAEVNAWGGFDFAFLLPESTNLGDAQILLNAVGSLSGVSSYQYGHPFQIQEFRRPEFEVASRNETTGPYFVGDHAIVAVEAKYYAGGPLPNADVTWTVSSSPSIYQPPNWPDFTFGIWTPWWWYSESMSDRSQVETYAGSTDASGNHYLRMDFEGGGNPQPISIMAEATVFDVNRQAWASMTSLLVHPANLYVGMRSERYFVSHGTPLEVDLIVTDLDGNAVLDRPIHVSTVRLEWKYEDGRWQEKELDEQLCTVGSEEEPVNCTFETPLGGRYRITATITDEFGRENQSQITRWVSGGQEPPSREVEKEIVTLIPDKETYQPGDVAEILVQAPFAPAEGLMTVTRSGILYTERFRIGEDAIVLKVPITEAHIPNLVVQVDVVGATQRTDDAGQLVEGAPPRPAFASGQLTLSVPPLQRTLSLEVTPEERELEPGGQTTVEVVLKDAHGEPVSGAELAVVVVDEAVLALSNYQLADPISIFYQLRSSGLGSWYTRDSIILANPLALIEAWGTAEQGIENEAMWDEALRMAAGEVMLEAPAALPMEEAKGIGGAGEEASQPPIRMRTDFNPLATFAPQVHTDARGRARVEVQLPDNLTRYRVMVVAVDGEGRQFGMGEANLTARLPLMVRPSAPRFLNFGDRFELPVVLQNQTDEPMIVEAVLRATNLQLTGDAGLRVEVPAHDRVEVRFPATTERAGTARFQVAAVSGDYADAATVELPVYTPATTEAFATYGVLDSGSVAQPVAEPTDVFPQYGGLEISTSSTALQSLTDAVLYLVSYPFECSEQLASRILGVAALRDVLSAFDAEGLPPADEIEAAVQRDIERLAGLQNWDGGFPYWRRGQDSIPFNTIHVAHALQRAKLKGFDVPQDMQERLLDYLRDIENHYPHWYSLRTRQTLSAYALYVRNLMGDKDTSKARALLAEAGLEDLSLDAVGWLWQVLVDDPNSAQELEVIRRHIGNRVVETAGAANFTTTYDDQSYLLLSSDRRTDGILLDTLILDDPASDLIPKLVNGLLAHRSMGHWGNTQEDVFILLALDRYFNTFEAQTPDFVARIWLGDTYAGSHIYEGRTTERHETIIPMAYLVDEALGGGTTQDLILSKLGDGRLYYRLGLRYAPTDLEMDPIDMGFVVLREYEAVDDPQDVTQDEDGVWHIRAGARVRIRLTMVADNRRYHVALVDPLPAGLEIVNPALAVSGSIPQDPNSSDYRYGWWWWWPWYEHQNMRDERAEAFTPLLWDGVYEYTYVARATTPGTFVVPPAKAEEMYSPEVFGRSASDWVIVE